MLLHFLVSPAVVGKWETLISSLLDKDSNPIALCEQVRVKLHSSTISWVVGPLLKGDELECGQNSSTTWFRIHTSQ
jgi:hypothetical protein